MRCFLHRIFYFSIMQSASLHEIKKELQLTSASQLVDLCIALSKYKKENKEFLNYLLFQSHDKNEFIKEVKLEIDSHFIDLRAQSNLYYVKKGLRKTLRLINKYCKYLSDKALAAELHIYFCAKLKNSGISFRRNQLIVNLYAQEIKKIQSLVSSLHEDLRGDFARDLEEIRI